MRDCIVRIHPHTGGVRFRSVSMGGNANRSALRYLRPAPQVDVRDAANSASRSAPTGG